MNPSDVFYLLRAPEARPRTLGHLAADALALAIELTSAAAGDEVLALLMLDEAQAKLLHAARLLEEAHDAMHAYRLSELEQLCVNCGHDRGEHLVEAPHACEHVDKEQFVTSGDGDELVDEPVAWDFKDADGAIIDPCFCLEFVPPWTLDTRATDRIADTERPPAPETA